MALRERSEWIGMELCLVSFHTCLPPWAVPQIHMYFIKHLEKHFLKLYVLGTFCLLARSLNDNLLKISYDGKLLTVLWGGGGGGREEESTKLDWKNRES